MEADDGPALPLSDTGLWIFGYGSLVWKPAFEHARRIKGYVKGYTRRFWQGSTDHRGVPGQPGRVVTLIRSGEHAEANDASITWGMAYLVAPERVKEVLSYLDYREKGGYTREVADCFGVDHELIGKVLVYRATLSNPEYLGPATVASIATQICLSRGPSGYNIEYLLKLAASLRNLGVDDEHVHSLEEHVLDEHVRSSHAAVRSEDNVEEIVATILKKVWEPFLE